MTDFPGAGTFLEVTRRFTQADFDEFAAISGDDNPIHVDPEFSARTRFGRTVAHGMFLFGVLNAVAARWLGGPLHVIDQQLTFTAPTFTDEDVSVRLVITETDGRRVVIDETMVRPDGVQTAVGRVVAAREFLPLKARDLAPAESAREFKGMRPGMQAGSVRSFTSTDLAAYRRLVDDPNPAFEGSIPPALIGGIVSCLLGVELPGRGTNWLKQHYRFTRPVGAEEEIRTVVEVSRLRPDKALVDLTNRAETPKGPAMSGETLVLAADATRI